MNISTKLDLIQNLIDQLEKLDDYEPDKTIYARDYENFRRRAEMIIRITCGENSKYITYLNSNLIFSFDPNTDMGHLSINSYYPSYKALDRLFLTIEEEFKIIEASQSTEHSENSQSKPLSNKVFIVHGHDEAMKQAVARTLEKLQLDPIILHEKPSAGRTIMQMSVSQLFCCPQMI